MRIRLAALVERAGASLFLVPSLAVLAAVVLGTISVELDRRFDGPGGLPPALTSTVESSRAVLTTVAGASISFAGIAFSVSLLIIQLGSSQYSPRVVHTLFRDPFNRRVMGLVVGTFTFCLVVLRSAHSALEENGTPVIPNLSVIVAVILGIITILAVVAFINHSAHSMDISEILERVRREAVSQIEETWTLEPPEDPALPEPSTDTSSEHEVRFERAGWVQQIDTTQVLELIPPETVLRLNAAPGRYAIVGTSMGTFSPAPSDTDELNRRLRWAVGIGDTRTMQQDMSYGVRQLVDVALKALSPGINDPTTAQDAMFHASAVLLELLRRFPPPSVRSGEDDQILVLLQEYTHKELIDLTFDEVRRAAAAQPTVCIYLLEAIHLLIAALPDDGYGDQRIALVAQARLIVAGCEAADLLPHDLELVQSAYRKRFGIV